MDVHQPNPFEVLRLDPAASEEEVVRQAGRLRQRATDEAAVAAVRQAVQALTGRAEERALHAALTHPRPCYHWPALERFVAAFRRLPLPGQATPPCPEPDLEEFAALVRPLAAEELDTPPLPFERLQTTESAEEIDRQTAEALWQALPFDMRA